MHAVGVDVDAVDETQIDDVHPGLGVVHLPQRFAHGIVVGHVHRDSRNGMSPPLSQAVDRAGTRFLDMQQGSRKRDAS